MKRIGNRQYKLSQIRPRRRGKPETKAKRGRRYNSRLDRRGTR